MSDFGYKLTAKAEADLDQIVFYIAAGLDNQRAATDFLPKLQDAINDIRSFPESGALVENEFLPYKTIRKKHVGNYIMYYLPNQKENMIYVLRILYGRRNLDEILREI